MHSAEILIYIGFRPDNRRQRTAAMAAVYDLPAHPVNVSMLLSLARLFAGRAYIYEIRDRKGNAKSLGPWSEALAAKLDAYRHEKMR